MFIGDVNKGDLRFRKMRCTRRGKKTGKCYDWEASYLDLKVKEDEEFIRSAMILVGEGEL